MPAFGEALNEAQIDALADYILHRRAQGVSEEVAWKPPGPMAISQTTTASCVGCHKKQADAWRASRHAMAMGPGVIGQYGELKNADVKRCNECHAPALLESREQTDGVDCVSCHLTPDGLRGLNGRRHIPIPETSGEGAIDPGFRRSDSCLHCHNLPLGTAVDGRPLLDTWREWAASRWLPNGTQCHGCHMPNGDHGFHGAHDPGRVRSAVKVKTLDPVERGDRVSWGFSIGNVGAGHHFPTTATPRAIVTISQTAQGVPLESTHSLWSIGREVEFIDGQWVQHFDTRIPSGAHFASSYEAPRRPNADGVRLELSFFPDWHYTGLFETILSRGLSVIARERIEAGYKNTRSSAFLVERVDRQLAGPNER